MFYIGGRAVVYCANSFSRLCLGVGIYICIAEYHIGRIYNIHIYIIYTYIAKIRAVERITKLASLGIRKVIKKIFFGK